MGLGFHLAAPLAPPPHYIGGQGAVLVDLGGVESLWDSYSQRESFPPGNPPPRRIAILLGVGFLPYFAPPTPWTTWGSLGCLPPRLGAWVVSGTARNLPEPSRTFRDRFGTFRNLLEHFQELPGPFSDVPEPSR